MIPTLNKKNTCSFVYSNGQKILFEPLFGYRRYVPLPDFPGKIFDLSEVSSSDLGQNVREVLANSRVLDISEVDDFFDDERLMRDDRETTKFKVNAFGKKNKSAVYKEMMQVFISIEDCRSFCLRPTKHERSDIFSGLSPGMGPELIYKPLESSDEELGDALKLAFSRCIGVGAFEFHKKLKALGWE